MNLFHKTIINPNSSITELKDLVVSNWWANIINRLMIKRNLFLTSVLCSFAAGKLLFNFGNLFSGSRNRSHTAQLHSCIIKLYNSTIHFFTKSHN